jgi:DNA-binding NarL/FixJ family response regulator
MNDRKIRLVLVDENAAVRRALVLRLTRADDLQIIGDTGDLDSACELVNDQNPDVLLMESKRRDGAALKFCQRLLKASARPHIVILTSFANEDERLSLQHLGIEQYLLKDIDTEELIRVIREEARQAVNI